MSERNSAVQAPKHAGWSLIEADMPAVRRSSVWACVRPRETEAAGVPDAICITRPCQLRMLPKDFPPVTTVHGYCYRILETGGPIRVDIYPGQTCRP
jgi:hypothetical protein